MDFVLFSRSIVVEEEDVRPFLPVYVVSLLPFSSYVFVLLEPPEPEVVVVLVSGSYEDDFDHVFPLLPLYVVSRLPSPYVVDLEFP